RIDDAAGGSMVPPSHNRRMATALSLTHLGSLMRGVRSVDEVGADERAASLAKRSIKKSSKLRALDLAVRCMDLTTLEGADTPGKVAAMCAKAVRPKPGDPTIPPVAAVCGDTHLKVILETGELGNYDAVRRASILAMAAGADFIKTSTGKVQPAATLPVALVMMEAIRDFVRETGRPVGFKAAGGIRTAKQAISYLVVTYETLGAEWMTADRLRLGASTLLNDVLMQIEKERSGAYQSGDYFTVD